MKNRRHTVGARPAFALLEMDIEIPEDVFDSPPMVKLQALTVDMLCIANASGLIFLLLPLLTDI